jgi:transposase InsO family protein
MPNFPFKYTACQTGAQRLREQARSVGLTRAARHRLEWLIHAKEGGNVRATCRHFGIAPKVFYFWQQRFCESNLVTLECRSSKPRTVRQTRRTNLEETQMIQLRQAHIRESAKKLSVRYAKLHPDERQLSAYQFACVIEKYRLYFNPAANTKLQLRRKRSAKKLRITQFSPKRKPFKLFEIDTVVLFWGSVKVYLITAIDRVSRVAFARMYTSHGSRAAADFLKRLTYLVGNTDFALVPDNGSEFHGEFIKAAREFKITLAYARPNTPKDKPQVERFNRTIQEEFIALGNSCLSVEEFNRRLTRWLIDYNMYRPHQSLRYLSPLEWVVKYYPRVLPMYPVHTRACLFSGFLVE